MPQPGGHAPFQIHRSYIVVETEDGLALLDQHALHERRIYEELLLRFERSAGEDQHLLVPDVVELSAPDCALVLERQDALEGWGIRVESFGPTTLCVRSLPAALSSVSGAVVIEEFLTMLRDESGSPCGLDLVRGAVANMACRAAVKFNDPLEPDEIAGLVAWWRAHPELRNCPHGRPVALGLSLQELELQFKRKV